ncbi:MAG TPA: hypothetical protein DDW50_01845 [Firmicutes bacterium]|nr:hypothetical protein [Bacillota bacterium]
MLLMIECFWRHRRNIESRKKRPVYRKFKGDRLDSFAKSENFGKGYPIKIWVKSVDFICV